MTVRILVGDALSQLKTLDAESVQCCVTSPPYWGLRDYGVAGQLGLEKTPDEYVARMVDVFREVRRVLRKDGTLWLNIGDSYAAHPNQRSIHDKAGPKQRSDAGSIGAPSRHVEGLKAKDLVGIPWMLAFALRSDGWYLRSDIIWAKPNPMPESVTDRPTKAHEYVFLLSKSASYYYDAEAIAEPLASDPDSWGRHSKKDPGACAVSPRPIFGPSRNGRDGTEFGNGVTRNRRSVWTVATQPFKESHFATMPPELAETCIKAGCPEGQTVLDPFGGAGTTGLVADRLSRHALLIELNPDYARMAQRRIQQDNPMFADVELVA